MPNVGHRLPGSFTENPGKLKASETVNATKARINCLRVYVKGCAPGKTVTFLISSSQPSCLCFAKRILAKLCNHLVMTPVRTYRRTEHKQHQDRSHADGKTNRNPDHILIVEQAVVEQSREQRSHGHAAQV